MSAAARGGEARPRGLPGPLPEGERVLWQGSPDWRALAWRAFHVRDALAYVALFAAWRTASAWVETGSALAAVGGGASVLPFALVGIGLLAGLAWLTARYATYTLTDRRVVLSVGVALTATLNLPLAAIQSADLRVAGDGTGDLSLGLGAGQRIAFAQLWPHVRPWRFKEPQPTLRAVPDAERVAALLAGALAPGGAARVAPRAAASSPLAGAPAGAALAS